MNKDFFEILLQKNKYYFLRVFLDNNKNDILKALDNKVAMKNIYNSFKEIYNINIKYRRFCQILLEFKLQHTNICNKSEKYIVDIKEDVKEDIKDNNKILAAKILQENKIKEIDNTNNEKISRKDRLMAIKNKSDDEKFIDVQKNQNKFVWKPTIK